MKRSFCTIADNGGRLPSPSVTQPMGRALKIMSINRAKIKAGANPSSALVEVKKIWVRVDAPDSTLLVLVYCFRD